MNKIFKKEGVSVLIACDVQKGLQAAKEIIYKNVDERTVLFLSGGSTPKPLYEEIAREKKLKAGAVALVDERYGEVNHTDSNEKMIRETGLVDFYPILENKGMEETARDYEKTIQSLFSQFPKKVGIFGMGDDGHTAGIAPNIDQGNSLVSYFDDGKPGFKFGKRITLTFKAMEKFDYLIILAFGSAKKNAFDLMFKKGSLKEIPSRFYLKPEIANKTLLITDQKI